MEKFLSYEDISDFEHKYIERLDFDITKAVIFDIETTGFKASTSKLYLIGLIYYKDNRLNIVQWFAKNTLDEKQILVDFFEYIKDFKILIHFNGATFDIPYIIKKCEQHKLPYNFDNIESIDLYKNFKSIKRFLIQESLKLKDIEKIIGFNRKDKFSGGELISVFFDYLKKPSDIALSSLLLHNKEDVISTFLLIKILVFPKLLSNTNLSIDDIVQSSNKIELKIHSDIALPITLLFESSFFDFKAIKDEKYINMCLKIYNGEMRHYFSNYKDYYYLPIENIVIHKSTGQFVDNNFKEKANKNNCFVSKVGSFLPQASVLFTPEYKANFDDKMLYFELDLRLINIDYIIDLLKYKQNPR